MAIAISMVELQLHIAEALARYGIGAEAFGVVADSDGGWRLQITDSRRDARDRAEVALQIETALGHRYRIHRLSLGGAYGG